MITPLFGKAIYYKQLDIDTEKIVSMIDAPRKPFSIKHDDYLDRKKTLYVLEEEKFKFLKDIILGELHAYAHGEMKYVNEFQITTSWFTHIDKEESSQFHNHQNCFISGVLYLQTSKNCGNIEFQDFNDDRFQLSVYEDNIYNSKGWGYEPKDGIILFFPSEVRHRIGQNKSGHQRYSLAFNIIPVGLIGEETEDSHAILRL